MISWTILFRRQNVVFISAKRRREEAESSREVLPVHAFDWQRSGGRVKQRLGSLKRRLLFLVQLVTLQSHGDGNVK